MEPTTLGWVGRFRRRLEPIGNIPPAQAEERHHAEGEDVNVRAVWLFRNDALGNLAVVVAAGLAWWTGTAWPDLAVAAVIAARSGSWWRS